MQDRPRSMSGFKPRTGLGLLASLPGHSSAEELPTTPLPTINDQLDQRDTHILPAQAVPVSRALVTRQLSQPGAARQVGYARVTQQLSSAGTFAGGEGASARGPMVIKGGMKKPDLERRPPRAHWKRRLLVSASGVLVLVMISTFALLMASPLGHDVGLNSNLQTAFSSSLVTTGNSGRMDFVTQATATAVSHQQTDGYDPYSNGSVTVSV